MEITSLTTVSDVKAYLAQVSDVGELKQTRDKIKAVLDYARSQGVTLEQLNEAMEIGIRVECKLGEMLAKMERSQGLRTDLLTSVHNEPKSFIAQVRKLEIPLITAKRWQLEAEVPEDRREQYFVTTKEKSKELTRAGLIRIAKEQRRAEKGGESPPLLPLGIFSVIYADPPWQYDFSQSDSRSIEAHYPPLSIEKICDYKDSNGISVQDKFASDAVLFLWATQPKIREALQVIEAWGFNYTTGAIWIKDKIGMGYWWREKHELLFLTKKGNFPTPAPENRPESTFEAPRLGHSQKPELVYNMIETMCPLPHSYKGEGRNYYLELFARVKADNKRPYWEYWGNENG